MAGRLEGGKTRPDSGESLIMQSLLRNPAMFPDQNRFGGSDAPAGQRGNCFSACIAALLNLPLQLVPNFYDTDETSEQQWAVIQHWLAGRGWFSINYDYAQLWDWKRDGQLEIAVGSLGIISGFSPRGPWLHAVIGQITADGWRLIHDPHPSKAGIAGDPTHFQIVAPLPWAAMVED